ncbi:DUF6134 family protein [Persicitalea sp.]|uniref:DUF6134 family protein n=1 Tax=Persicitalea sp. TaxID=3100273 RepID=UPI003593D5F4
MKELIPTLALGLVLLQPPVAGQAIVYDILLAGRSVGELTVAPSRSGDGGDHLRVKAVINTFLYDVVYVSENRFENGVLKASMSSQEVNGKLKEKTNTVQTSDRYRVTFVEGKAAARQTTLTAHPINHTVTSLYYREPLNLKHIYSDRYGEMCAVQQATAGAYDVVMPDGKKTRYTYAQGQCHEVKVQIVGLNLIFRIQPGSVVR